MAGLKGSKDGDVNPVESQQEAMKRRKIMLASDFMLKEGIAIIPMSSYTHSSLNS